MNVAIVYHMFPHYRLAVMRALDQSGRHEYTLFGDPNEFDGVKPLRSDNFRRFVASPFYVVGGVYWQGASIRVALSRQFDAIIYLANPNFLSTWIGALIARLTGKRVLFWTHGWLKPESRLKSWIRNAFYRLAHKVLVYGERAKTLGVSSGFPADRIAVIYNSLDEEVAARVFSSLEHGESEFDPRGLFAVPTRPLLICTARLTSLCRFDLLLEAVTRLRARGRQVNVVLVGEGPERTFLEELARKNGVDVHFYGACYDEWRLGALIYGADLTVSPGKVGLTAMHSLMYGTPVITHSDLDAQMPEVEAIVEGVTGAFFVRDDVEDLARVIEGWLCGASDKSSVRAACRRMIADKWNPTTQVRLIEGAIGDIR